MKTITTAAGKRFDADWCGVSFANTLYAALAGAGFEELLTVFLDEKETETLTFDDDGQRTVYTGYTRFLGLQLDQRTGFITVNLAPKEG